MEKTLGVSMIVKNEAECIVPCLESVKEADEIVICDTGSEDNTVELCKKYTDKVYTDYKWNDDFSEARNHSLSKCTTDWIMIIDADEILDEDILNVKRFLNNGDNDKYKGVTFFVKTKTEEIVSCRIIRNIPGITWTGAVHNVLTLDGESANLRANCYASHYNIISGYSPAHLKDPDRSMRILKKELKKNPDNTRYIYYLAREHINRAMKSKRHAGHSKKVIELLTKYDGLAAGKDWTNEYADAMYLLCLAYMDRGDWVSAVRAASWSYTILPSYKAPADFMMVAMGDTPKAMHNMPAHSAHWKHLRDIATNANVAQIRDKVKK